MVKRNYIKRSSNVFKGNLDGNSSDFLISPRQRSSSGCLKNYLRDSSFADLRVNDISGLKALEEGKNQVYMDDLRKGVVNEGGSGVKYKNIYSVGVGSLRNAVNLEKLENSQDSESEAEGQGDEGDVVEVGDGVLKAIEKINKATSYPGESGKLVFNKSYQLEVKGACIELYQEFVEMLRNFRRLERELSREKIKNVKLWARKEIIEIESEGRNNLLEKQIEIEKRERDELLKTFETRVKVEVEDRLKEFVEEARQKEVPNQGEAVAGARNRNLTYARIDLEDQLVSKDEVRIVVKSKEEGAGYEQVKKKLVERLQLDDLEGGVRSASPTKEGAVFIESQNKEKRKNVREIIVNMDSSEAIDIKDRKPVLRLTGVDKGYNSSVLKKVVWSQNRKIRDKFKEDVFNESINFVSNRICRNENKENWTASVSGELYKIIMDDCGGRLYLDLVAVFVEEVVNLVKCFKCCGYGHISSTCRGKECCPNCGGEHRRVECEAKFLDCPNCKRLGFNSREHSANDIICPAYQRKLVMAKKNFIYK